jgi:hypothetical protein
MPKGLSQRSADPVAARFERPVVIRLGGKGPARHSHDVDRQIGGAGLRAFLQARRHTDAGLVRQQQHRSLIDRCIDRFANREPAQESAHTCFAHRRVGGNVDLHRAQPPFDDADLHDAITHRLHRHDGGRQKVAPRAVLRGDGLGQGFEVAERHVAPDVGLRHAFEFVTRQRLRAIQAKVVQAEGGHCRRWRDGQ